MMSQAGGGRAALGAGSKEKLRGGGCRRRAPDGGQGSASSRRIARVPRHELEAARPHHPGRARRKCQQHRSITDPGHNVRWWLRLQTRQAGGVAGAPGDAFRR